MFYMFSAPRIKKVTAELTEDHNLTKVCGKRTRRQSKEHK